MDTIVSDLGKSRVYVRVYQDSKFLQGCNTITVNENNNHNTVYDLKNVIDSIEINKLDNDPCKDHTIFSPFPEYSFAYLILYFIDPRIALFRKKDLITCIRKFYDELQKAMNVSDMDIKRCIQFRDCMDEDGSLNHSVLMHLSSKLSKTLVVRENDILRIIGGGYDQGALLMLEESKTSYMLMAANASSDKIIAYAKRDYIESLDPVNFSNIVKPQLSKIANSLGIKVVSSTRKSALVDLINTEISRINNCNKKEVAHQMIDSM
jgi:hypothetical protein